MSGERGLNLEEDLTVGPTPDSRRSDGESARDHSTGDGPTPEAAEADRRE